MTDRHYIVRRIEEADFPTVWDIECKSFISPWDKELLEKDIFKNPFARYLCIETDGRVIGFAGVWLKLEEAHLMTLAVSESERRMGAGELLMKQLIALSGNSGCMYMELECRESNTAAQRLYKKLGFIRVGRRKGYYSDTGEDALVMALLALPHDEPNSDQFMVNE